MTDVSIVESRESQGSDEALDAGISPAMQLGCLLVFAFVLYELLAPFWQGTGP